MEKLTPVMLADFLWEHSLGVRSSRKHPSTAAMLKALGFLANHAEVPALQDALKLKVVQSLKTEPSKGKKREAVPLPWHLVVDMEEELMNPVHTVGPENAAGILVSMHLGVTAIF